MDQILKESCQRDNDFFKGVINLIPPLFYFDSESKHKLKEMTQFSSLNTAECGKNPRKNEWKLTKYNPACANTVTEMQKELLLRETNVPEKNPSNLPSKTKLSGDDCSLKSATDSLEELREKLHDKLQILKDKRKCMKRSDWLEKRRLKRKVSKMKNKLKKSAPTEGKYEDVSVDKCKKKARPTSTSDSQKPIYNSQGKIVFSKFDFSENKSDEKVDKDIPVGKNYKHLLEKVKKQKQKRKEMKEVDVDKAQQWETKTKWNVVMQKAKGVKVKDNEELLRKALKRKEKFKQKTKKQWEIRQDKVEIKMSERQDKRKGNINKKKQAKVDRKLKKAKRKGKVIPGF